MMKKVSLICILLCCSSFLLSSVVDISLELNTPEQEKERQLVLERKRERELRGPISLYPFGNFGKKNQNFFGIAPLVAYSPRDFYGIEVGVANYVGRNFYGLSCFALYGEAFGFSGVQIAGLFNFVRGNFSGV